jgi:hypothetical protein
MEIDPTFNEERIIFNIEQLMAIINAGTLRRGMAIVFDEIGVAANVKEHASQSNKAASYLLQTIRPYNLCVIFSTPSKSYVDKQLRGLFDMFINTISRKFVDNQAKARPYWVQYNEETGKVYRHSPTAKVNGEVVEIKTMYIQKPHESIITRYRERRKLFVLGISEEQTDIINVKKAYLRRESAKDVADGILSNKTKIKRYLRYWRNAPEGQPKKRVDQDLLSADYGIGNKTAYKVKKYLEAKLIRRSS